MRPGFVASPNYYNNTSGLCTSAGCAHGVLACWAGQNSHAGIVGVAISQCQLTKVNVVLQKLQVL